MTCIVGLVHEGVVYIGGDSAGVGGMSLTVRADEKVLNSQGPLSVITRFSLFAKQAVLSLTDAAVGCRVLAISLELP